MYCYMLLSRFSSLIYDLFSLLKDDMEAEMARLKLEIKKTMELYQSICEQATVAKQQVR